jgi:hypothetical protein
LVIFERNQRTEAIRFVDSAEDGFRFDSAQPPPESFRSHIAFGEQGQFSLRHNELRDAASQADQKIGKYKDGGHVDALQSGRAKGNFSPELL